MITWNVEDVNLHSTAFPTSPSLKIKNHVKNDYFQISPYSNYIRWSLNSVYTWLVLWGSGTWGVGWIVVVLGFSQTAIPVPQFPEAQQASRSIRGNGAVLTSATLLLRLIPYTEVKGWGLRWGKEWKSRNNVTAVPLLTSLSLVLMSVFALFFLSWPKKILLWE